MTDLPHLLMTDADSVPTEETQALLDAEGHAGEIGHRLSAVFAPGGRVLLP